MIHQDTNRQANAQQNLYAVAALITAQRFSQVPIQNERFFKEVEKMAHFLKSKSSSTR